MPPRTAMLMDSFELKVPGDSLTVSMKRYYASMSASGHRSGKPVTLLLAHAAGFHKEHWEPVMERLFYLQSQKSGGPIIKEAWALDCQDHGESAVLNEEEIHARSPFVSCYDYGKAFIALLQSEHMRESDTDIIAIGHSAGAVALILSTSYYVPPTNIPYSAMILVDPAMVTRKIMTSKTEAKHLVDRVVAASRSRRDVWKSLSEARSWLESRAPWKYWDPRVMNIYLEHGLRLLPTASYPDMEGVTLKCSKGVQGNAHKNISDQYHALDRLNQICDTLPVHVIFGGRSDYISRDIQNGICDETEGRKMASISYIPDVGHMAVQEAPDKLANEIFSIVTGQNRMVDIASKL